MMIQNQRGVVTIEFIFSLIIGAGLTVVLFSVTYTMAVVEVTQYVVYSAARAQLGANKDPDTQRKAAVDKFKQMTTGQTAIGSLYDAHWFQVATGDQLDVRGGATADGKTFSQDLAAGHDKRNWFIGVSTPFTAMIMNFKWPLIGSTNPDNDDNYFKTHINAMLIREPSQKECQDFMEKRRSALSQLPSGQKFYQSSKYVPIEDNGC